jgi:hypothetical protein
MRAVRQLCNLTPVWSSRAVWLVAESFRRNTIRVTLHLVLFKIEHSGCVDPRGRFKQVRHRSTCLHRHACRPRQPGHMCLKAELITSQLHAGPQAVPHLPQQHSRCETPASCKRTPPGVGGSRPRCSRQQHTPLACCRTRLSAPGLELRQRTAYAR